MADYETTISKGLNYEESLWVEYGYRFINTLLAGSVAVLVNIIVGRILSTIKTKIRGFLAVGEMNFVVDFLFGVITLGSTAVAGLLVDRRLKWHRMMQRYGGNGEPPLDYYLPSRRTDL